MSKRRSRNVALKFLSCSVLAAGMSQPAIADTLADMISKGEALIAIGNEPPYTQITPDGQTTGVGPDLVRAVLDRLGIPQVKGEVVEYGAMIPSLQASRVDLVSSGTLFITPQRCEAILFSEPDVCDAEGFAVPQGNPRKLYTYGDIAKSGAKIGLCSGCAEEKYAEAAGVKRENIVTIPDGPGGIKMLADGRVDAVGLPLSSLANLLKSEQGLEVSGRVADAPLGCMAVGFRQMIVR